MILFVLTIFALIGGIILITISSDKAVKHTAHLARALGISSLIIGVTVVSIGTDLAEILNSLISSYYYHADIDMGDSLGSIFTQITLIFGLLPILCGMFTVKRKEVLILGSCEIISLIVLYSVIEKGYFTRINALFVVGSLIIYFLIIYTTNKDDFIDRASKFKIKEIERSKKYHTLIASLAFLGVTISAFTIVFSIIYISEVLKIPEFIISFFLLSIGTSLPELAVDISALRRKEHNIALGDIIGSCIVDATLSIGIGQTFFPQSVSADLALIPIIYTIFASFIIFLVIFLRKKVDKRAGILFIALYFSSYLFVPILYNFL
ncbi:MAG: sodium:calcium antiporter [Promethearchaeota archaeon]